MAFPLLAFLGLHAKCSLNLAYDKPTVDALRPKNLSQLLNAKKFSMDEQYHSKFETVQTQIKYNSTSH